MLVTLDWDVSTLFSCINLNILGVTCLCYIFLMPYENESCPTLVQFFLEYYKIIKYKSIINISFEFSAPWPQIIGKVQVPIWSWKWGNKWGLEWRPSNPKLIGGDFHTNLNNPLAPITPQDDKNPQGGDGYPYLDYNLAMMTPPPDYKHRVEKIMKYHTSHITMILSRLDDFWEFNFEAYWYSKWFSYSAQPPGLSISIYIFV